MSKGFTFFLGVAELAGGLGVAFGVLTQLAALGLILIMFGAIWKKISAWHTGFWGGESLRLALRSDLCPDEPGHRFYGRRCLRPDAVAAPAGDTSLAPVWDSVLCWPHLGFRFVQIECIA
jgi:hypothetical protein